MKKAVRSGVTSGPFRFVSSVSFRSGSVCYGVSLRNFFLSIPVSVRFIVVPFWLVPYPGSQARCSSFRFNFSGRSGRSVPVFGV